MFLVDLVRMRGLVACWWLNGVSCGGLYWMLEKWVASCVGGFFGWYFVGIPRVDEGGATG